MKDLPHERKGHILWGLNLMALNTDELDFVIQAAIKALRGDTISTQYSKLHTEED